MSIWVVFKLNIIALKSISLTSPNLNIYFETSWSEVGVLTCMSYKCVVSNVTCNTLRWNVAELNLEQIEVRRRSSHIHHVLSAKFCISSSSIWSEVLSSLHLTDLKCVTSIAHWNLMKCVLLNSLSMHLNTEPWLSLWVIWKWINMASRSCSPVVLSS